MQRANLWMTLPGERREIRGTFPEHALAGEEPVFRYAGLTAST